jgi:flagellin-like protein
MRRSDLDICADILVVAKRGAKKTHIVYRANLNFNLVTKYLRRLIENGLLRPSSEKNVYTTAEGIDFLEQYRKLNTSLRKKAGFSRSIWRSKGLSNVGSTLIILVVIVLLATVATLPLT